MTNTYYIRFSDVEFNKVSDYFIGAKTSQEAVDGFSEKTGIPKKYIIAVYQNVKDWK